MRRVVLIVAFALSACKSEQPTTVVIAKTPTTSQSATPGTLLSPPTTSEDSCLRDSECTWGEIPREINSPGDCMCLLGCPFIAQNKATESRRSAQHMRLCKGHMDGKGNPCPIDDCAAPPPISCVNGKCAGHR